MCALQVVTTHALVDLFVACIYEFFCQIHTVDMQTISKIYHR